MSTKVAENAREGFPNNLAHQTLETSPRTSSSTRIHFTPAQPLQLDTPRIHISTILPPKDTQVFHNEPGPDPESTSKKRARVDSGVSLSSISSLFKIHHSKSSTRSRSNTITSKFSVASTTNTTLSSTSTALEDPPELAVQPKKVKFAVKTETAREKFHRESQARRKVIDDQIKAHHKKERARNQRAADMLRVSRQYQRVWENELRKIVRGNEILDKGTRIERFKTRVRGVFIGDHKKRIDPREG